MSRLERTEDGEELLDQVGTRAMIPHAVEMSLHELEQAFLCESGVVHLDHGDELEGGGDDPVRRNEFLARESDCQLQARYAVVVMWKP